MELGSEFKTFLPMHVRTRKPKGPISKEMERIIDCSWEQILKSALYAVVFAGHDEIELMDKQSQYIMCRTNPPDRRDRTAMTHEFYGKREIVKGFPNISSLLEPSRQDQHTGPNRSIIIDLLFDFSDAETDSVIYTTAKDDDIWEMSNLQLLVQCRDKYKSPGVVEIACEYYITENNWVGAMALSEKRKIILHGLAQRTHRYLQKVNNARGLSNAWKGATCKQPPTSCSKHRCSFSHVMKERVHTRPPNLPPNADDNDRAERMDVTEKTYYFDKMDPPPSYKAYVTRKRKREEDDSIELVEASGRPVTPTDWSIDDCKEDLEVGLVLHMDLFTDKELKFLERKCNETQRQADNQKYLPDTFHHTRFNNQNKRTKYFFSARYLWTKEQTSQDDAERAGGVRVDVDKYPRWVEYVIARLEEEKVVEPNWLNGCALNMYHDGTLGIGLHMDCYSRFDRPIITLRLFSPARLSLGCVGLKCSDGVCCVDLPRGAVLSMMKDSYASDGVKHCVRDCDMFAKSAALILRRFHPECMHEAKKMQQESSHEAEEIENSALGVMG